MSGKGNLSNCIQRRFGHQRVVLPVIHVTSEQQAVRNARIALEAGADGVFLIDHSGDTGRLLLACGRVCKALPFLWVGLNFLSVRQVDAFWLLPWPVKALWADDACVHGRKGEPAAARVNASRASWQGLYFGGVAHKGSPPARNVAQAARAALPYVDVVTTSGPATGVPPSVAKVRRMKEAIGAAPLAVASGITPENVGAYLPWVDCFLVATGVSRSFDEFDSDRLATLIQRVREWEQSEKEPFSGRGHY